VEQSGTDGTDFDAAQLRAVEALVGGATVTAAAQAAGVGRTTMHRWLNDPAFSAFLNQTKREHLATIHAGLRTLAVDALLVRPVLVPCGYWLINRRRQAPAAGPETRTDPGSTDKDACTTLVAVES
jgi:hypothetical protein